MADYPDWVMKYKKKGTYINRVKDKYYLYAAHSERVPGTKKVRRVSDGYIGRITEEDGLIPAQEKIGDEVFVFEYGLCSTLFNLCSDIHSALKRSFRDAADRIFVAGILSVAYGDCSQESYHWSFLSIKFPDLDIQKNFTDKQMVAFERCKRMITDVMNKTFKEETDIARIRLTKIFKVKAKRKFYTSALSDETKEWLQKYNIDWRNWFGKDRKDSSGNERNHKGT